MFNTFIGNGTHYEMPGAGRTGGDLGSSNTVVANNIFMNGGSMAGINSGSPYTGTWTNNIRWNTSSAGNMPASGYSTVNPLLATDASGVFHLQSGSPAINAGRAAFDYYGSSVSYSNVTADMDGQPRDASLDIGADEFSAAPVLVHILSTNDVGIAAGLTNQLSVTPASHVVPPGLAASYTVNFTGDVFTSTISLSISNLPSNTTAGFNRIALTNTGNSILTVTTTDNTPPGNYALTVRGIGGGMTNAIIAVLIVSANAVPRLTAIFPAETNIVIQGANGPPYGPYSLLTSTNLTSPPNQWIVLATGAFDMAGSFVSSNEMNLQTPQQFYLLQLQ